MLNGLWSNSLATLIRASRPTLIIGAIALAIGLGAVGTAKPSAPSKQASTESVELLQDSVSEKPVAHASIASMPETITPIATHRVMMMEVTAYCACKKCCGPNAQGITASGKMVDYNNGKFVAADTSVLPFGTKIVIPGYHEAPVEVIDRGGAIKGNKLDVFYASHEEALVWGRQKIEVRVMN